MSIDKDLVDQLMEGRKPGNLFGKDGILQELTKALAEPLNHHGSLTKNLWQGGEYAE